MYTTFEFTPNTCISTFHPCVSASDSTGTRFEPPWLKRKCNAREEKRSQMSSESHVSKKEKENRGVNIHNEDNS